MGIRSRLQYALGFGLAAIVNLKVIQDLDRSVQDQKGLLDMIDRYQVQQVEFRNDSAESTEKMNTVGQAYSDLAFGWIYKLIDPNR